MAIKAKGNRSAETLKLVVIEQKTTSNDDVALNLRLLRAILDAPRKPNTITSQPKRPKTPLSVAPAQNPKTIKASQTSGKDGKQAVSEQKKETSPKPPDSVPEQRKLAMNCFNQSLKVLSAVVRKRQASRLPKSSEGATKGTESHARGSQEDTNNVNGDQISIITNAECAGAALQVLRLHDQHGAHSSDASYKREQGAVLLLDRMITLDLRDMAYTEASRILDQYWKRRKLVAKPTPLRKCSKGMDLAVLLSGNREVEDKEDFDMLTSCHSQLLRLALLLGPAALNEDFVRSVKIATKTSPADVVISGQEKAYTTPQNAGENLRAIAQALSKISAATVKSAQTGPPDHLMLAFDLLVEAQLIKLVSWQLLEYGPDHDQECWTAIERGIRSVWSKHPTKNTHHYKCTKAHIERLQKELESSSLPAEMPISLRLLLCQLAEVNDDCADAIESLKRFSSAASGSEKLIYTCRMATAALQAPLPPETVADHVEQAAVLLTDTMEDWIDLSAEYLSFIVKLRKACSEKVTSFTMTGLGTTEQTTQVACLRVLFLILRFCHHLCKKDGISEKVLRSLNLAILKGIENILDAEKFATESPLPILVEYLRNLEQCVDIISGDSFNSTPAVQNDAEHSILYGLEIRISNVFWRSHLHPSLVQTSDVTPLRLAQISVACLNDFPIEHLSKAALGPRLEKLCAMCLREGEVEAALIHITRAIKHYILTGALSDAVEASLSQRGSDVWVDAAALVSQLGRVIHTRNSLFVSANDEALLEDWIYRDESLPPIHQAVLLEHQISYMLRKHANSVTFMPIYRMVKEVVALAHESQYQVWLARFVSSVVFRASRIPHLSPDQNTALLETAGAILDFISQEEIEMVPSRPTVLFLRPYSAVLQIQLKLQCALIAEIDQHKRYELQQDVKHLLNTIESCSESKDQGTIIDDVECLMSVLEAYTDQVFALCGYESAILCLKVRIRLEENCIRLGGTVVSTCHIQLALCQIRLHDTKSARGSLHRIEMTLKTAEYNLRQAFEFQLTSAEYHLSISDLTNCSSSLREAGSICARLWPRESSLSSKDQIEHDNFIARGALLASNLAFRQGDSLLANRYARQATKISVSIWSALEKRFSSQSVADANTTVTSLTEEMSKLNVDVGKVLHVSQIGGPRYWPYLEMHARSIKHLVSVLSYSGLSEDSLHYLDQLKHLTSSMPYSGIYLSPAPSSSVLFAKSGRKEDATQMINDSILLLGEQTLRLGHADAVLTCCEAHVAQGNLDLARALLMKISAAPLTNEEKAIRSEVGAIAIESKVNARGANSKVGVIKAPPKRQKGGVPARSKKVLSTPSQPQETSQRSYDQFIEESRHNAIVLACQKASELGSTFKHSKTLSGSAPIQTTVQELYEEARCMLKSAWDTISADAFASVLTESAMALPARVKRCQRRGRISLVQGSSNNIGSRTSQASLASSASSDIGTSCISAAASTLESAFNICNLLLRERPQDCPTDLMHSLLNMEARISLLLTSMSLPFAISSTDLVLRAAQPKDCALERERIVSLAELATQDRTSLSIWPSQISARPTSATCLTERQLDDLPATWSVLSLTLAEGNDELLLSKVVAGRDPFLVRIPLHRSTDDDGAEEFSFDDAEAELKEIIKAADSSSHDARGSLDKATRAQWHADREALDHKLASLLGNIETIWLGGFRGVLSPQVFEAGHIKDLGSCLNKALNKHLPSRQKGSVIEERVEIHNHILETFLGLGDPAQHDLDDSIMDLLYFVVDVLQFNGERNAYDEIDWDTILIDVLDALRTHYSTVTSQTPRHTILVLDKELELFPWEALPCLINHPVSRMPSLGSIFEHLTQIRTRPSSRNSSAHTIEKSSLRGAYILNPSGDLKSTQESLSPILADSLPALNYTSLIGTPPTEPQFSSLLTQTDILLYIGHGSGAQYIRPRTIRALESCAVTFLFGCSSAKMTTHGKFESTGMPRAYMLGHAPALVGCLWDVTDREIDRVAVQTLVSWGLVDGGDKKVQEILKRRGRKTKGKGKEKERVRAVRAVNDSGKTLIEAVKDGREACVLKYLCGAAVVVYGVPVVLT